MDKELEEFKRWLKDNNPREADSGYAIAFAVVKLAEAVDKAADELHLIAQAIHQKD